ncbi:unnamed protein product [Ascophyllum nodosum]
MTSIRAGLIGKLLKRSLTRKETLEILWHSSMHDNIEMFNLAYKARKIMKNDGNELDEPVTKIYKLENNGSYLFDYLFKGDDKQYSERFVPSLFNSYDAVPYYKPVRKNISYMYTQSEYSLEEYVKEYYSKVNRAKKSLELAELSEEPDIIDLSWKPYNKNSKGIKNEKKALVKMREMGYVIEEIVGSRKLSRSLISGKPDGFIKSGPDYKGCILEIKPSKEMYNQR